MITSVFSKSKPINFVLCVVVVLAYFVMHLFSAEKQIHLDMLTKEILVFFLLIFSLFMVDFIIKKNVLTQKNDFALLFITIFLGWFPSIFSHVPIVAIFVLVLLAFRRIVSLRTLNKVKQKLFDASMYISLAMLFDSWAILYFIVIYLAIILFVSSDYRNWLIPILVYAGIIVLYFMYQYIVGQELFTDQLFSWKLTIAYPITSTKTILLHTAILLLFAVSFVVFLAKYKTFSSQKKLAFLLTQILFFVGIFYVVFSQNTTQIPEIVLLFPLAVSMANLLQNIDNKRMSNSLLILLMIVSFSFYFYQ